MNASMIVGMNLRTTMVDKDESLFSDQNDLLYRSGCRAVYYADDDDEFDWFVQQNGHWYRDRFYHWWLDRGAQVLVPVANSNVGVENSVPPNIWQMFLKDRNGWATMARKDLISAIIRTKHAAGWDWLLQDIDRRKRELPKGVIGVIGADLFLFGTDAWVSGVQKTSYNRLTTFGKSQFTRLGNLYEGDAFADFANDARKIWPSELIDDACFVYNHGNGIHVESKYGDATQNVVEFGVSLKANDWQNQWDRLIAFLKKSNPKRALVHTPIDPSEAWRWKQPLGTRQLWTYAGYGRLKPDKHEFTLWPTRAGRQAIRDAFKTLGSQ